MNAGTSDCDQISLPTARSSSTEHPAVSPVAHRECLTEVQASQSQPSLPHADQVGCVFETTNSGTSEPPAGPAAEGPAPPPPPAKRPASAASGRASPRRKRTKLAPAPAAVSSIRDSSSSKEKLSTGITPDSGAGADTGKARALQTSRVKNAPISTASTGLAGSASSAAIHGKGSQTSADPVSKTKGKGKASSHVTGRVGLTASSTSQAPTFAQEEDREGTHAHMSKRQLTNAGVEDGSQMC